MRAILFMAETVHRTRSGPNHESWRQTERREAHPFDTLPFNSYSRRFH